MPCSGTLNCGNALSRASCARQSNAVAPVRHQLLQVGQVGAIGPRLAGRLVGPARAREALAQIGDRRVGHVQFKRRGSAAHRGHLFSRGRSRGRRRCGRQPSGTGVPAFVDHHLPRIVAQLDAPRTGRALAHEVLDRRRQAGAKAQREAVFGRDGRRSGSTARRRRRTSGMRARRRPPAAHSRASASQAWARARRSAPSAKAPQAVASSSATHWLQFW